MLDLSLRQIAQVNSLFATPVSNPFLAHRKFHSSPNPPKKDVPFEYQATILRQDAYALDLKALKYEGVAKSTSSQLSAAQPTVSSSITTLSVINAAAVAQNGVGKQALKTILPMMEKRPTDVGLLLTILHLYVLTNNVPTAVSLLETFFDRLKAASTAAHDDVRFAPGLVAVAVALYSHLGRKSHAKTLLYEAASHWRSKHQSADSPAHAELLRAAGSMLLGSGDAADATKATDIFTFLHDVDPADRVATAGLVASLSLTDPSKLNSSLVGALTPSDRLVSGIDAAALESAGVPLLAPAVVAGKAKKRSATDGDGKTAKKRKLPKSRMPKEYVEGKEVDPERWLPMRDRSYWRPKGKKGKAREAGLTQGGVVEEEKKVVETKVVTAGGGNGGGAKKKKKGKK
jgi:signal recognition particle subunit SRP72